MAANERNVKVNLHVDASEFEEALRRAAEGVDTRLDIDRPGGWRYELAVALGYEPESWDGMWKLVADPFTIGPDYVLAEEVVYFDGDGPGATRATADNRVITQFVRHPLPEGWTTEPVYRAVPPEA